jgi:hypothetical protein
MSQPLTSTGSLALRLLRQRRINIRGWSLCQQNLKVPSGQIADTQQRPMNKLQMNFLVLVVTK